MPPQKEPAMRLRFIAACLSCAAACAGAANDARESRMGTDMFIGGGSVTLHEPVGGDLFAAGGAVDLDAAVGGDAVVAGGKLRIGGDVGQSVYVAGGQVNVNGKVGHNLRVAGGQVELGPKAEVSGNVSAAGGHVRLYGAVRGHVQAAGGRVLIDAPVGGDVLATSGHVELGPRARIAGKLRYRSGEALHRDPAAQVSGGIEQLTPVWGGDAASRPAPEPPAPRDGVGAIGWVWTAGLVVLAAVWLALAPSVSARLSRAVRERTGLSVLLGFVWLVCVPVLALLLLLTVIGIPLALFVVAVYFAVLPLAYVAAAVGLGDWALTRWQAARAALWRWRLGAAALALVLLTALGHVPWLGVLLGFAVLLAGLGAFLLQWRKPAPPAAA
jgi:cytoskeletal protein CcmA (bactofilin family)